MVPRIGTSYHLLPPQRDPMKILGGVSTSFVASQLSVNSTSYTSPTPSRRPSRAAAPVTHMPRWAWGLSTPSEPGGADRVRCARGPGRRGPRGRLARGGERVGRRGRARPLRRPCATLGRLPEAARRYREVARTEPERRVSAEQHDRLIVVAMEVLARPGPSRRPKAAGPCCSSSRSSSPWASCSARSTRCCTGSPPVGNVMGPRSRAGARRRRPPAGPNETPLAARLPSSRAHGQARLLRAGAERKDHATSRPFTSWSPPSASGRLMTLETRDDRTLFFDLLPLTLEHRTRPARPDQAVHRPGPGHPQRDAPARAPGRGRRRVHRRLPAERDARERSCVRQHAPEPHGQRHRRRAHAARHPVQQARPARRPQRRRDRRARRAGHASRSSRRSRRAASACSRRSTASSSSRGGSSRRSTTSRTSSASSRTR